jgi:hypothetical protein
MTLRFYFFNYYTSHLHVLESRGGCLQQIILNVKTCWLVITFGEFNNLPEPLLVEDPVCGDQEG